MCDKGDQTRVMIARCQVATGQAAGAGVSRQPIIVMMMGRAGGGHLVHTLLSTATVSQCSAEYSLQLCK